MHGLEDALIEYVKNHPILYRNKEKTHFSIMCKNKRWLEIAKTLNLPPEKCKAKWRNIRDSYKSHMRKKKLGTSPVVSKFDDEKLSFLSEECELDEPVINGDYSSSSCNSFEGEKRVDPLEDNFTVTSLAGSKPITEITGDIEVHLTQPAQANVTYIDSTLNDSEQRKFYSIKEPHEPKDETNIHLHDTSGRARRDREGSPTHNFFSSMADIVCKFPPEKIAEMRMRVCCLVSEMEVQILRDGGESS